MPKKVSLRTISNLCHVSVYKLEAMIDRGEVDAPTHHTKIRYHYTSDELPHIKTQITKAIAGGYQANDHQHWHAKRREAGMLSKNDIGKKLGTFGSVIQYHCLKGNIPAPDHRCPNCNGYYYTPQMVAKIEKWWQSKPHASSGPRQKRRKPIV